MELEDDDCPSAVDLGTPFGCGALGLGPGGRDLAGGGFLFDGVLDKLCLSISRDFN